MAGSPWAIDTTACESAEPANVRFREKGRGRQRPRWAQTSRLTGLTHRPQEGQNRPEHPLYLLPYRQNVARLHHYEKDWFPLLRPLDSVAAIANALGSRRAPAINRPRRRGGGVGRGRRLFPRPPLRPSACRA